MLPIPILHIPAARKAGSSDIRDQAGTSSSCRSAGVAYCDRVDETTQLRYIMVIKRDIPKEPILRDAGHGRSLGNGTTDPAEDHTALTRVSV